MKIVIIGGTAAGLSAASKAKRNDPSAQITVYEKSGYVSYGSCGLPYFVGDMIKQTEELISLTPEELINDRSIDTKIAHEVLSIDRNEKTVSVKNLNSGEIFTDNYDKLVLATGATPIVPPFYDKPLSGVHFLRNVEDGISLKRSASGSTKKVVIIGAGLIGLEVAEQMSELGHDVTLLEAAPRLLPMIEEKYADMLKAKLAQHNIKLMLALKAQGLKEQNGTVTGVTLENGETLPADLVVMSIGVRPNGKLLGDTGIELYRNGAVLVDEYLQTADPDVYACGDCATAYNSLTKQQVYIPMGTTANKQGKACGDNITGLKTAFGGVLGSGVTKLFDTYVAFTGLTAEQAKDAGYDAAKSSITKADRASYYPGGEDNHLTVIFDSKSGRILGAQGIGSRTVCGRVNLMVAAISGGMTVQQLGELDLLYTPSVAPVHDPLLILASQAVKKVK